jgi:glycosyltransferase involved in cell wall biosynthesis
MAQLFLAALRLAGHKPMLASRFRSYEGSGDLSRQTRLAALARQVAERRLRGYQEVPESRPELWFTYHVYHKSPDWLGPEIASVLDIPYVVAEASVTPRQISGPWAIGYRAAKSAIRRADAVIGLNPSDRACVLPLLRDPSRWIAVKPFLDGASYRKRHSRGGPPRLITVAMMRHGDKLTSYRILGHALSRLLDLPWSLEVVGDGPARPSVEDALGAIADRVTWTGSLDDLFIAERLALADIFVWPAYNEAFGMALLEAQASGLPVVAGMAGGVGELVDCGVTGLLVAPGNASAFAAAVRALILDPRRRQAYAKAARRRAIQEHNLPAAARRLNAVIDGLGRSCAT